jgi:hypothetical protein
MMLSINLDAAQFDNLLTISTDYGRALDAYCNSDAPNPDSILTHHEGNEMDDTVTHISVYDADGNRISFHRA